LKQLFLLISLALVAGCTKDPPLWEIENLSNNEIMVYGHGGMGINSLHPMDSKTSLLQCLDEGADGIEMDLQMSKDSVLYLFHNVNLSEGSSCNGLIREHNASELDCSYRSVGKTVEKLITLQTLFSFIPAPLTKLYTIECKVDENMPGPFMRAFARQFATTLKQLNIVDRTNIECTNSDMLIEIRKNLPEARLFIYTDKFESAMKIATDLKLYGITLNMHNISLEQVRQAHSHNFRVSIFDQKNENDNLESIQLSPDNIQTDKLEHLLDILEKK
jgi:glycerophosphoryl diester phosphodiesterase